MKGVLLLSLIFKLSAFFSLSQKCWDSKEFYLRSQDIVKFESLDSDVRQLISVVNDTNDGRWKNLSVRDSMGTKYSYESGNKHFYSDKRIGWSIAKKYTLSRSVEITSYSNPFYLGLGYKCQYTVNVFDYHSRLRTSYIFNCEDNKSAIKGAAGILYTGRYIVFLIGKEAENVIYCGDLKYEGPYLIYDIANAVTKREYKKRKRKEKRSITQ